MKDLSKRKKNKTITAKEFDAFFEEGKDLAPYLNLKKATVIKRVNVDFPLWMVEVLDKEALKLNVSRQAVIKTWIQDHLNAFGYHYPA